MEEEISQLRSDISDLRADVREVKTILIEREKVNQDMAQQVRNQLSNVCPAREARLRNVEWQTKLQWWIIGGVGSGMAWLLGQYVWALIEKKSGLK